jgi:hypothetical protein
MAALDKRVAVGALVLAGWAFGIADTGPRVSGEKSFSGNTAPKPQAQALALALPATVAPEPIPEPAPVAAAASAAPPTKSLAAAFGDALGVPVKDVPPGSSKTSGRAARASSAKGPASDLGLGFSDSREARLDEGHRTAPPVIRREAHKGQSEQAASNDKITFEAE